MAGQGRPDAEDCKMFVGGLTRDTTADMLKGYFSYYGRIVHAVVMTNPETQKSRGFGFVAFSNPEAVDRVIMSGPHFLDGKQIDPKPSVPKDLRPKPPQVEQPKKAFLGGLPLEMNETDMRDFFSRYGVVTECYIMYDEKRMKSRGFGFVSFEDDSVVDDLVKQHYIDVKDKRVEVKLARPRENPLAPLNSEGRVLSVDAQQQRAAVAAAATASAYSRHHPPPPGYYEPPPYDSGYYAPPPPAPMRRPAPVSYYDEGPPAPKRPRGARTPPDYPPPSAAASGGGQPPPSASDYYRGGYDYPSYGSYDDRAPPPSYRGDVSPPGARRGSFSGGSREMPKSSRASTFTPPTSAYPPPSSKGNALPPADASNMTPESMASLMQQAMQSMSGGGGATGGSGMNMMSVLMSNMMTQMFMNQAQTMFQSAMQQKKSESVGTSSKSEGQGDMMEAMKGVLQTLMTSTQQDQSKSESR